MKQPIYKVVPMGVKNSWHRLENIETGQQIDIGLGDKKVKIWWPNKSSWQHGIMCAVQEYKYFDFVSVILTNTIVAYGKYKGVNVKVPLVGLKIQFLK